MRTLTWWFGEAEETLSCYSVKRHKRHQLTEQIHFTNKIAIPLFRMVFKDNYYSCFAFFCHQNLILCKEQHCKTSFVNLQYNQKVYLLQKMNLEMITF